MRRIRQKDDEGCGVACAAMLSGQSYAFVRKLMFAEKEVRATSTKELIAALAAIGCRPATRLVPLRSRGYRDLEFDAVLKIWPRQNNRNWHWVVWDFRRKRVIDPLEPPYKRVRAISYLKVLR